MTVQDVGVEKAEWVPITQAWKTLGLTHAKFYRRMDKYKFARRTSKLDERLVFVNLTEIRQKLDLV